VPAALLKQHPINILGMFPLFDKPFSEVPFFCASFDTHFSSIFGYYDAS
jgi:hypothetical protein